MIHYYQTRHEAMLEKFIADANIPSEPLKNAIHYSLFPGGKRLRPLLVYLAGLMMGVKEESLDIMAVAVELIHAYSLIHDDLPSMDNDDLRRGKPSCHKAFGESTAILVGDGLQALAIEILLKELPKFLPYSVTTSVAFTLVKACGFSGMVSGQYLDLNEKLTAKTNESQLMTIQSLKTGQLILACFEMVLNASKPSEEQSEAFKCCAKHLGFAFQMQDDYLDHYADPHYLGKNRSSDKANHKVTLADFYDQQALLNQIHIHFKATQASLTIFKESAMPLLELINSLIKRNLFVDIEEVPHS